MFDFDSGKLLIIGIVALVVIGPKDLPRVLRQVGQMVSRVRRMAGEFQGQFMEAIKEADLQDIRTEVAKLKDSAKLDVPFDPVRDAKHELMTALDGTGSNPAIADPRPASESEAVPRASKTFPSLDLSDTPAIAAAGLAPVAELPSPVLAEGASGWGAEAAAASEPTEAPASGSKRKIQVGRRAPARGRVGNPARSRNILPARRDAPDA